ncbi:bis-aminopropyl spermidine synthase family protein [Actinokineospora bangkokensis]|uniref:N(4)-bis(aminopropyl)spermidine synthase C-terminal domain-containing protein n=1 Tax=Actinokineospora bangkokensis TaxID=1193682 RepID=A0A1Q9LEF4_9PSEU|nr:bis-aminopropyl spermidine synthase family protein [Actinokineospora bangkokensis]OLR90385.1 hypothetical protein BJP25_27410 [Actinokineospora bangkokensis]
MGPSLTTFLDSRGAHSRPLRELLADLAVDWLDLDELVRRSAQPRRTVEELLAAAGDELERDGSRYRATPGARDDFTASVHPDPAEHDAVLAHCEAFLRGVPVPLKALDHVQADAATMARRALWLGRTYWLEDAHLLCVGDHDLTALAACAANPGLRATVVDVDERLLSYVDAQAREHDLDVRCLHADFRFGLPPAAVGSADLVFTDPPYTPEGMRLFLARGVEGLRSPEGRLLVAYGYSTRNPTLGLKVQREVLDLGLVFEAALPSFNRYHGAQAVGSASDLYVLQPTTRSPRLAEAGLGIYTHGPQSVESASAPAAAVAALLELTGPRAVLHSPGWAEPFRSGQALAFDLTADPGPWLARTLLAAPAVRVGALVVNNHPDTTNAEAQRALRELVAPKFDLTFHRSIADGKHAVVAATPVDPAGVPRALLDRAHGKLANTWREALVREVPGLTKREARDRVAALAPSDRDLENRLVDLPLDRVRAVLRAAATP